MNQGIERVTSELLPQLHEADQVIISHQITDPNYNTPNIQFASNTIYLTMHEKGLSKNRNNALKAASADICYICDDDLNFLPNAIQNIKTTYQESQADLITFQAQNEKWELHFQVKEGKHSPISVLRIRSRGISFKREKILKNQISFNEEFWLWAKYCVGEENIFLTECYRKGLKMLHNNTAIVFHPSESSGIDYKDRKELIIARIKVFKQMYGILGAILGGLYITVMHYKFYSPYFSLKEFIWISLQAMKKNFK